MSIIISNITISIIIIILKTIKLYIKIFFEGFYFHSEVIKKGYATTDKKIWYRDQLVKSANISEKKPN